MAPEIMSFDALVGENLRHWRTLNGRSLEQFSVEVQWWGLPWGPSTLAKIERGERPLQAAEFIVLTRCVRGLENLLVGQDEWEVSLTKQTSFPLRQIVRSLAGKLAWGFTAPVMQDADDSDADDLEESIDPMILRQAPTPADAAKREHERTLAKTLGVTPLAIAEAAFALWGHGLTEEREERLSQDPTQTRRTLQALRGHVTRDLKNELAHELGLEA